MNNKIYHDNVPIGYPEIDEPIQPIEKISSFLFLYVRKLKIFGGNRFDLLMCKLYLYKKNIIIFIQFT